MGRGFWAAPASPSSGDVYQTGLLSGRPSASTYGVGWYFATDDNGGTLYRSNGTSWSAQGPGVSVAGGTELAYAARTTNLSSLTSTAQADVAGLALSFTLAAARMVDVVVQAPLVTMTLTGTGYMMLFVTDSGNIELTRATFTAAASGTYGSISGRVRVSLNSGTTNLKVRYAVSGTSANGQILSSVNYPTYLQAIAV